MDGTPHATPMPQAAAPRAAFPVLADTIYLNSNSTGAFPAAMQPILARYWQDLAGWRDETWERWWADWLRYTDTLAALIGAPAGSVVTDTNLSTLLGRVACSLRFDGKRNTVVTTDLEFPTVPFIWNAARARGAQIVTVPSR
ncbi:MAG TPA: hypothetical protein VIT92_09285, partial [Burkholderiaceae bacterium]